MHFFTRRESKDDHLALDSANFADDMDMIISDRDGALVAVAVVDGAHSCWICFGPFIRNPAHRKRPEEFNCGGHGTRIQVHAKCLKAASRYKGDIFYDKVQGHQGRRFLTQATKDVAAAGEKKDSG